MDRICYYSDDSYSTCGKKTFHAVIAGAAITMERTNIRRALVEAERISGKKLYDWRQSPPDVRQAYIDAILSIPELRGRIFYRPYDALPGRESAIARQDTLASAIDLFTTGSCNHEIWPEGLQGLARYQLRTALRRRGYHRVTVEAAQFVLVPEVRLSDALAGYVRGELYRGDGTRSPLSNLPDWFENLEPEKRNPPE